MPPAQRFGHSESPISVIAASLSSKLEPSTSTQCPNDRLQTLFIFTCCIKIISPSLSLHSTHKPLYLYMWFFFSLFVWQENSKRCIEFYNRYIYIYISIYIYIKASNCQQRDKIQTCHQVYMTIAPWPTKLTSWHPSLSLHLSIRRPHNSEIIIYIYFKKIYFLYQYIKTN